MVDKATLLTEEKFTILTEKIITGTLDEPQKNLSNVISGTFEISKLEISELQKKSTD